MLAALLATRPITPTPIALNYGNQFLAATTTFDCIAVAEIAADLTTSLPIRYELILSLPGQESVFDQLTRTYRGLVRQLAADNPAYLNTTIIQSITVISDLTAILQSLPVVSANVAILIALQQRLAIALYRLRSLARTTPPSGWPDERNAYG